MSKVGQKERATQNRVVKLFQKKLGYTYLGNWEDRYDNSNIGEEYLRTFLKRQGYRDTLITRALYELDKVAGDQTRSLYDINKAVYNLLRYGVQVKPDVGENTETVWLIDWRHPLQNDFALAEEITIKGENTKRPDLVLYVNGIALGVVELKRSMTIENNLRRLIIDEMPINPKYYEKMSELLDTLIQERQNQAQEYEQYLASIIELAKQVQNPTAGGMPYPKSLNTRAKQALYDNLGQNEQLALNLDAKIQRTKKDGWRGTRIKGREVRFAIQEELQDELLTNQIFELVKNQHEY